MELPDETLAYEYQGLLTVAGQDWNPAAEARGRHFVEPARLKDLAPRLLQIRSQVAAERDLRQPPPDSAGPLQAGFIDLPQKTLDDHRRHKETSLLGRVLLRAQRMRDLVDHVVLLGAGGSVLGSRALFSALKSTLHDALPAKDRPGVPRLHFAGDDLDNDGLRDLLELLEVACVDPDLREERWGVVVAAPPWEAPETAAAYRILRREMAEYYGADPRLPRELVLPLAAADAPLRPLFLAEGFQTSDILPLPGDVGDRFGIFTPAGLVPAALLGLDVRALLLGAATMTRRFLDEPFERNPVLQFAAVNHLMATEKEKPIRVLAVGSHKLEAIGRWYDRLLAESLGKCGQGVTPQTVVGIRDLTTWAQLHLDGPRDKMVNHLLVKTPVHPPLVIGMEDRNEDDLNRFNRKGYPDLHQAALAGFKQACWDRARPTADLVLPSLSEYTVGQLLQMLMLATVVEARLRGVNPYGQPGFDACHAHLAAHRPV